MFYIQIILSTKSLLVSKSGVSMFLNIRPDMMNASRLPNGIVRPQRAVTNERSLSGNQSPQNYVIILKNNGHERLNHTSPARIGQNF